MNPGSIRFAVAGKDEEARAMQLLEERFAVVPEHGPTRVSTIYDTFDWRLHRAGGRLSVTREGGRQVLVWQAGDAAVPDRTQLDQPAGFPRDLPQGSVRDALVPLAGLRRLLPVGQVRITPRSHRILNEDAKTVARVVTDDWEVSAVNGKPDWRPVAAGLSIFPLRGYERDGRKIAALLRNEAGLRAQPDDEVVTALLQIGVRPGSYRSRPRIELDRMLPAGTAVRQILAALLATMQANEDGLIQDLDTEFLHDYRVAVRRTRSCLGQMKRALAPDLVRRFRTEFAWLGRITGPVRDLDVFRIDLDRALQQFEQDGEALVLLVGLLEKDRQLARQSMIRHLRSTRYRGLIEDWSRRLGHPDESLTQGADQASHPIGELADARIARAYRRMLRDGRRISESTPAGTLHRLRIDGKKLRYSLEFFLELYEEQQIAALITALKRLQNVLGTFNDLQLQQAETVEYARRLRQDAETPVETLLAMGRLIERMARREATMRRRFGREFQEFASADNRERVRRMTSGVGR